MMQKYIVQKLIDSWLNREVTWNQKQQGCLTQLILWVDLVQNGLYNFMFFNDILLFTLIFFGQVNLTFGQPKSESYSSNGQVE